MQEKEAVSNGVGSEAELRRLADLLTDNWLVVRGIHHQDEDGNIVAELIIGLEGDKDQEAITERI